MQWNGWTEELEDRDAAVGWLVTLHASGRKALSAMKAP